MTKKKEQLQNGFQAFLQKPTADTKEQTVSEVKDNVSKHNLFVSDSLFVKLKILQARSGKTQAEVLDTILRQYFDAFEKKNGVLVADTLEL